MEYPNLIDYKDCYDRCIGICHNNIILPNFG